MKRNLVAIVLMAVSMLLALSGCKKEGCTDSKASNYDADAKKDNGTCVYTTPQPDPTDTIVIPTKEKTFDWDLEFEWAPSADSIKKYTDDPEYKYVFINATNLQAPSVTQEGMPCSGYPTRVFKRTRDTLQTRLDINPKKVRGSGTIIVDRTLSDDVAPGELGIPRSDSTWYADNGWRVAYRQITMGK